MDYKSAQLKYMTDIHMSDASLCEEIWKTSLYEPLRERLSQSLQAQTCKEKFVYIGCGPLAPIIEEGTQCFREISKFDQIVLVDISETYLLQAKSRLDQIFSDKTISYYVYDITNGLSEVFYKLITSLLHGGKSTFIDRVGYLKENFEQIINRIAPDQVAPPVSDASYIYSELVATYTGIPALFDCEHMLTAYGVDVKPLMERIFPFWQAYNERVYSYHVSNLSEMVSVSGVVSVATDIEKIYLKDDINNVGSFSDINFPMTFDIEGLKVKDFDKETMWDDSGSHKYDQSAHINTSAHLHRIGSYTYEKF
jgi:hypothetical protein